MSGLPRSPTDRNGGLEKLLFQLRQTQNVSPNEPESGVNSQKQALSRYFQTSQPQANSHVYHPSITSSPLPILPAVNEGPYQPSADPSPSGEAPLSAGGARPSTERSASTNLLDLLKFSQPAVVSQTNPSTTIKPSHNSQEQSQPSSSHNRQSDLLATLLNTSKENRPPPQSAQQPQPQFSSLNTETALGGTANAPSSDTKNYLLQLLSRPKPSQTNPIPSTETSKTYTPPSRSSSVEISDLTKTLEQAALEKDSSLENETQAALKSKHGIFTYVNPFEQLSASSPRNRTPKLSSFTQSSPMPASMPTSIQILKPPRHISESSELKRKVDDRTPASSPRPSKMKLDSTTQRSQPSSDERARTDPLLDSPPNQSMEKGKDKATVVEAIDAHENVDRQAEVQVRETESQEYIEQELRDMMNAKTEMEFKTTAQAAATTIKHVLDKDENKDVLRDTFPEQIANAVRELVDETAQGHIAGNWETVDTEDSETKDRPVHTVRVYNFPVKPWLSISIRKDASPERAELNNDQITPVTKLRKEFDQIDRNLATASQNFIVYGMKNGGIRVICQSSAMDMKIFTETHDRIFNISLSVSQNSVAETIIGTGVSGTVYWVSTQGMDRLRHEAVNPTEIAHFALPPIRGAGEDVSGGVLKTRARASSDHPEFFAVGRGKYIYVIWPSVIINQGYLKEGSTCTIDVEKYLSRRSLKVNTGKAGKDFVFSQDDTVIASLDKAGRVKFWDVRSLTGTGVDDESRLPTSLEHTQPKEINEPMMTLITTPVNEKSWPTSVMFVDKVRPYQKGGPLRYLIVGMKQNHSLQLWDIALGKPVSEIHLPHEKESDAVCSVSFHPPTGMIIIGHPTRNSIYLLHLSAPKNSLATPVMTQAEFIEKLASKDKALKELDSTAVLSGIREYSFDSQGALRSLSLMQHSFTSQPENPIVFELYAMYSKGLSCISFGQGDLGWDGDNKAIRSADAVKEGLITTEPIKSLPEVGSPIISSPARNVVLRATTKETASKEPGRKSTPLNGRADISRTPQSASSSRVEPKAETSLTPGYNGGTESSPEKPEKRRKKKSQAAMGRGNVESYPASVSATADIQPISNTPSPLLLMKGESVAQGHSNNTIVSSEISSLSGLSTRGNSYEFLDGLLKNMEGSVSAEMSRLLAHSLENLYKRLDKEKLVDVAVAEARQEAVLRLVSSTLTDNVEKSLAEIVNNKIEQSVLPAVSNVASNAVHNELGENLKTVLHSELRKVLESVLQTSLQGMLHNMIHSAIREMVRNSLPPLVAKSLAEIHSNILPTALPEAIAKVLRNHEVSQEIAKTMVGGVTKPIQGLVDTIKFRVEEQFNTVLQKDITPAFAGLAAKTVEKASMDVQRQAMETFSLFDHERRADNAKIDQLTKLVAGLTETVSTMAAAQQEFQGKILDIVHQGSQDQRSGRLSHSRPSEVDATSVASVQPLQAPGKTDEQLIIDSIMDGITTAMKGGNYSDAVMTWLQSGHEQEIFDAYFSKFDPSFVREVNPLILLSLCSLVSSHFDGNCLHERLSWLDTLLQAFYVSTNSLVSLVFGYGPCATNAS